MFVSAVGGRRPYLRMSEGLTGERGRLDDEMGWGAGV